MSLLLEQWWHGNLEPQTKCHSKTPQREKLVQHTLQTYKCLTNALSDEQKTLLAEFENAVDALTEIETKEIFIYAFKLGAQFYKELGE